MIIILNYGSGNLGAIQNVYKSCNIESRISSNIDEIKTASKIILPGVGNFDHVISAFNKSGLREIVEHMVIKRSTPILGICVGMQIFAETSEEGKEKGLNWIPGQVKKFEIENIPYKTKIPHMGWNNVYSENNDLFKEINSNAIFYFVHSYYYIVGENSYQIATSNYGTRFCSAIRKNKIYGVQFHPEKSHSNGTKLLRNFAIYC